MSKIKQGKIGDIRYKWVEGELTLYGCTLGQSVNGQVGVQCTVEFPIEFDSISSIQVTPTGVTQPTYPGYNIISPQIKEINNTGFIALLNGNFVFNTYEVSAYWTVVGILENASAL